MYFWQDTVQLTWIWEKVFCSQESSFSLTSQLAQHICVLWWTHSVFLGWIRHPLWSWVQPSVGPMGPWYQQNWGLLSGVLVTRAGHTSVPPKKVLPLDRSTFTQMVFTSVLTSQVIQMNEKINDNPWGLGIGRTGDSYQECWWLGWGTHLCPQRWSSCSNLQNYGLGFPELIFLRQLQNMRVVGMGSGGPPKCLTIYNKFHFSL